MPDLDVDVVLDETGAELVSAKFSDAGWELNVRAPASDFLSLRNVRTMDWATRRVRAVGESAGARVFWAADARTASILVGHDDETWDFSVTVPLEIVDELVRRVEALPS